MPDRPDPFDAGELPAWAVRALRAPVPTDPAAKARLLQRVRAAAPAGARARPPRARRPRRGLAPLAGLVGLAAAAAVAGVAVLGAARAGLPGGALQGARHAALRDTIQRTLADTPPGALLASVVTVLPPDTAAGAMLRDTLRLVRFVLVAPTATRLALVGDFNRWDAGATPLRAGADGRWAATVPLPPGAHRYAFVLDDTGRAADPATPAARDAAGRPYSLVRVPPARR